MASARNIRIGRFHNALQLTLASAAFTMDQTTDQIEWVLQVGEAAVITRVGFRYNARTGVPPTFIISIQGVDTAGNPDGTIKGGGSPASATFTPPNSTAWDGTWQWVTLANSYSAADGEGIAIVIAHSSGTIDGSNNSSFTTTHNNGAVNFPMPIHNNAGTRARQARLPVVAYGTASRVFGYPMMTLTTVNLASNNTPDESALRFQLPTNFCSTYKVRGVNVWMRQTSNASTFKLILYSGTTVLQDLTFDENWVAASNVLQGFDLFFDEATLATLNAGSPYYVSIQPQSTDQIILDTMIQSSNAEWEPYQGGTDFYYASRTDAGAWTEDNTRQPAIALILDDLTAPSSSGPVGSGRLTGGLQ